MEDRDSYKVQSVSNWRGFIEELCNRIKIADFKPNEIEFLPELTKVQEFKLKKANPDLPLVFFDGTTGEKVESIII